MKKLHLLFINIQDVFYTFDEKEAQTLLNTAGIVTDSYVSIEIEDNLAKKLLENPNQKTIKPYRHTIDHKYYEKEESISQNRTEEDLRVYIIFNANPNGYECFWSPSGNNLNGFYNRSPERYLGEAIRVQLNRKQYIDLYAFFECVCDNF